MKDRPAYKDYAKQLIAIIFNVPINSGDKLYTFADRWLLLLGQLPIIIAMFFMYNYSPYSVFHEATLPLIIAYIIGILLTAAYWLFFVYRFVRFSVKWADPEAHHGESASVNQDTFGYFLETKQNRKQAWRVRGAVAALTTLIAALTFLCCYIMYGLAPSRLYFGHKQELDRLAELTRGIDVFFITELPIDYVPDLIDIDTLHGKAPESVAEEAKDIINSLNYEYIFIICKSSNVDYMSIGLSARWGQSCDLLWYPHDVTVSDVAADMEWTDSRSITKLDEHWWQIWYSYYH